MPRKYKRKTEREMDEKNMKNAICACLKKELGLNESARQHGVKRTTLQSRLKQMLGKGKTPEDVIKRMEDSGNESNEEEDAVKKFGSKYTVRQIFTRSEERNLANYIKHASNLNYGLTFIQIQKLAYEYAKKLPNCKIPQNWFDKEQAGKLPF